MDASPTSVAEKLASSIKWDGESLGLYAKACNGHLNFYASTSQSNTFQASNDEEFKETYEDKSEKKTCYPDGSSSNLSYKKQKLEIRTKRSTFDPEEFALYKRYQIIVHGEIPESYRILHISSF
ncbi:hypothetical protein HPP92_017443 [Vanilla planifolia]|uniref:Uncharacterized protein n=1 Tax=Vanilla planifolia TaxID=51239 RepID=A0A835UPM9_VANPL|nr:hypothetical protein HPP92_017443 [Vanilla planifolia]